MNIGVLSLQGGVVEHLNQIKALGHRGIEVKSEEDFENIDAIILPGGESTTMGKLLRITRLMELLREKIQNGMPVWGTCAGMILLAKEIENEPVNHLGVMNIKVRRNAFGTQIDSFKTKKVIKKVSNKEIELVFIRAPYVLETGNDVDVLCEVNDDIVAVRQGNILATSFHPELTNDLSFMKYFMEEIVTRHVQDLCGHNL